MQAAYDGPGGGHVELNFTKMQGAGNDYIYVNCFDESIDDPPAAAKFLSDRHFGIGSDGLVLILPSDGYLQFRRVTGEDVRQRRALRRKVCLRQQNDRQRYDIFGDSQRNKIH